MEAERTRPGQVKGRRSRTGRVAGLALVTAGLLVLLAVGIYFGYAANARSQLDELNYSAKIATPFTIPDSVDQTSRARSPAEDEKPSLAEVEAGASPETEQPAQEVRVSAFLLASYAPAYPGTQLHPKYWHEPLRAGTDTRQVQRLPDGFEPVSISDLGLLLKDRAPATRIRIPMIKLDSGIEDLGIVDLGDSRAYETPNQIVGHIPSTSDPGEQGNGWFFGHLESPIRGEGNVFHRLPDIPGLLENYDVTGEDPVYVTLTSDEGDYLYMVTATQVVHQDDLSLYDSDEASITLVACVPRLVYDHRILVTARLVGIRG